MNNWIESSESRSLKQHSSIGALGRLTREQRDGLTDLHLIDTLLVGDVNEPANLEPMELDP
jgi:hypothetical protein